MTPSFHLSMLLATAMLFLRPLPLPISYIVLLCHLCAQEKIVPGDRILITVKGETLASSSIVSEGVVSLEDAAGAAVVAADDDHAGN